MRERASYQERAKHKRETGTIEISMRGLSTREGYARERDWYARGLSMREGVVRERAKHERQRDWHTIEISMRGLSTREG